MMGYEGYSHASYSAKTTQLYAGRSQQEIFQSKRLADGMSPRDVVRECRDSVNHPESFPVIIGLDVTGSMGTVPHRLITEGMPDIMKHIIEGGLASPQICFMGIGDHECDSVPLQVGQFEASDLLLDKWLKLTYLEGGGGGNEGESYHLPWYFAAKSVVTDNWEKRGRKGVLITIGDEPVLGSISSSSLHGIMGGQSSGKDTGYATPDILRMALEKWDVHHIHVGFTAAGRIPRVQDGWVQLIGKDRVHPVQDIGEIPGVISGIILRSSKEGRTEAAVQNGGISDTLNEANDQAGDPGTVPDADTDALPVINKDNLLM